MTCGGCGAEVVRKPGASGPAPRFCNPSCKSKAWQKANPVKARAHVEAKLAKQRAARAHLAERPCAICTGPVGTTNGRVTVCPSVDCRRVWKNACQTAWFRKFAAANGKTYGYVRYSEARIALVTARNALIRGASTTEVFSPREVFERDDWICWLCEKPVDRDQKFPHPFSASLDHVIPVSKGGPHTRANTRCSHLTCNARRGARDVVTAS